MLESQIVRNYERDERKYSTLGNGILLTRIIEIFLNRVA